MLEINSQLLVTNSFAVLVLLINVIFAFVVLGKELPHELKLTTSFLSLTTSLFIVFFIIGFNVSDTDLAWLLFSLSSIIFLTGALFVHLVVTSFCILKGVQKNLILLFFYLSALGLMVLNFLYPEYFVKPPESWMFLNNYFWAGEYYFFSLFYWLFFVIAILALLAIEFINARKEANISTENKVMYTFIAFVLYLGFILTVNTVLYGSYIDLSIVLLFGLFIIPLTYGTSSRKVSDVSVVLKRFGLLLLFSISIALSLGGIYLMNEWLVFSCPGFPEWLLPLITAVCATAVIMYYWYTYMDTTILKYEFISVITHKFRTPLTRIKWSVQMLETATDDGEKDIAAKEIADSAQNLVDLTDMLVDASKMEGSAYQYQFKMINLNPVVEGVYESVKERMKKKEIAYIYNYDDSLSKVYADVQRLEFALQILFENAVSYTPRGGTVSVRISKSDDKIIFSISDTGIGITNKEQNFLFSKFYRSKRAKLSDPNGMGIGIFMAKRIIERHDALIWATSPGPNAGSTFWVSFPNAAHYDSAISL